MTDKTQRVKNNYKDYLIKEIITVILPIIIIFYFAFGYSIRELGFKKVQSEHQVI